MCRGCHARTPSVRPAWYVTQELHICLNCTSHFWCCESRCFLGFPVFVETRLRLYGSSCTKFGFKDSDVNIDIQYPQHVSNPAWRKKSNLSLVWIICYLCEMFCLCITFICPLYHIYVVWRLWNRMYSQMHQPDVLLLVKETLSICCELCPHPTIHSSTRKNNGFVWIVVLCPQLSLLMWRLIFMPGCLWSFVKTKTGGWALMCAHNTEISNFMSPEKWLMFNIFQYNSKKTF